MKNTNFVDAYLYEEKNLTSIVYRTNKLCYEEIFVNGSLYTGNWNVAGFAPQMHTVTSTYRFSSGKYHYPRVFELTVNGNNLYIGYSIESFCKREEELGLHVELTLVNQYEPVRVTLHTLLDGTDVIQRWMTLENLTERKMPFARISLMSGGLFNALQTCNGGKPFELGSMISGQWAMEGDYHKFLLPEGGYTIQKTDSSDRMRPPFFTLENIENGAVALGQLGFSGEYKIHFQTVNYKGEMHLSFRVDLSGDYSTVLTLDALEAFDTPSFHMCMVSGGIDDAVNTMLDHMRIISSPYPKKMYIEKALGPDTNMSQPYVIKSIDKAAEYGAELYFIDASWYGVDNGEFKWDEYLGDWLKTEHYRYQMPMSEISEYARSKGLKFGLWAEVERFTEKSALWDTEYPPKLHNPDGSVWQPGHSRHLDLSKKEGADWAYDTICQMVEKYHLDFFRIDYNTYPNHASDGLSHAFDLRYYANWYDVIRRVLKKYPDLIIQNCASGGARLDYGMTSLTANTQLTDQLINPMTFKIINGCSMMLPVEYAVQAIAAGNGHLRGSERFQMNICRFGSPLISWNVYPIGIDDTAGYNDKMGRYLKTFRDILRPNYPGCRIYHHTPDIEIYSPNSVGILEVGSRNKNMSMVGVFTLTKPEKPDIRFKFRGVDPAKTYNIYVEDEFWGELTGSRLILDGFTVHIENAIDSMCVIAAEKNDR